MLWSDFSTQTQELRETHQELKAALSFTADVHTSVSPKPVTKLVASWALPKDGSHSWFPVDGTLQDAHHRLYRIDSDADGESQVSVDGGGAVGHQPALFLELKSRVDELGARIARMETKLAGTAALERRCAKLEEEYSARQLLSEGRIRFLEQHISAMQQDQRGGSRALTALTDSACPQKFPGAAARHPPHRPQVGGVGERGGAVSRSWGGGGEAEECSELDAAHNTAGGGGRIAASGARFAAEAKRAADFNALAVHDGLMAAPSTASKPPCTNQRPHVLGAVPQAKQSLSYPGASSMLGASAAEAATDISGEHVCVCVCVCVCMCVSKRLCDRCVCVCARTLSDLQMRSSTTLSHPFGSVSVKRTLFYRPARHQLPASETETERERERER